CQAWPTYDSKPPRPPLLEAKRRNVTGTGVEILPRGGLWRKLSISPIPLPNPTSKLHVAASSAGKFDEVVLIERRYAARRRLTAPPIRLLRHARRMSTIRYRDCCANSSHSRAGDQHVARNLGHAIRHGHTHNGA